MGEGKDTDNDAERADARRKVRGIRMFYVHALIYGTVMTMLVMINYLSGDTARGNWWIQWPALTWGVVLIVHGILVHSGFDLFGADWEERKIDELLRRRGRK